MFRRQLEHLCCNISHMAQIERSNMKVLSQQPASKHIATCTSWRIEGSFSISMLRTWHIFFMGHAANDNNKGQWCWFSKVILFCSIFSFRIKRGQYWGSKSGKKDTSDLNCSSQRETLPHPGHSLLSWSSVTCELEMVPHCSFASTASTKLKPFIVPHWRVSNKLSF